MLSLQDVIKIIGAILVAKLLFIPLGAFAMGIRVKTIVVNEEGEEDE